MERKYRLEKTRRGLIRECVFALVFAAMAAQFAFIFARLIANGGMITPYEPSLTMATFEFLLFAGLTSWGVLELAAKFRKADSLVNG